MAVRDASHLREWLIFFLHGVEETALSSTGVFTAILEIKRRIESESLPHFTARRQENAQKLMRHLYAHPVIDVRRACDLLETTANTASALIRDLVKYGVLVEITGQHRNRLFLFDEYIKLFKS